MKTELQNLPNIGKTLAQKLQVLGINNLHDLQQIGIENIFIKLKTVYPDTCICTLYAIEGALEGVRWHNLEKSKKNELLAFYNNCKVSNDLKQEYSI